MKGGRKRTIVAHLMSMLGSWWGIAAVTGVVYALNPIPETKLAGFFIWVGIPIVSSEGLKFVIKRPRPVMRGEKVRVKAYGYAFPSSHMVAACMVAAWVLFIPEIRWWSYLFLLWPLGVGWSRVWLRAHDPIDILGGALLAVLCVLLFIQF